MLEYKIKIPIPEWLDFILAMPVLIWRILRYGYPFRRIPLTQGKYAIVDPADYYRLRKCKYKWHCQKNNTTYYAGCYCTDKLKRKKKRISMHRLFMKPPDNMLVDHINGNGLDNRKANLRLADYSTNSYNRRKKQAPSHSRFKGIYRRKKDKKWIAHIRFNYRRTYLGSFKNETDAAKAYDAAANKYHKEFAKLNFP